MRIFLVVAILSVALVGCADRRQNIVWGSSAHYPQSTGQPATVVYGPMPQPTYFERPCDPPVSPDIKNSVDWAMGAGSDKQHNRYFSMNKGGGYGYSSKNCYYEENASSRFYQNNQRRW